MQHIIEVLKNTKNPKDLAVNMMKQTNNPILNDLIGKAEKGDTKAIETFARNIFKEQGRNFDSEFQQFMKNFR